MNILHLTSYILHRTVVPGRVELPTSTLSVWRSNQLSYRTVEERQRKRAATCPLRSAFPSENMSSHQTNDAQGKSLRHLPHNGGKRKDDRRTRRTELSCAFTPLTPQKGNAALQKGGVPAAPSGTATLLRLSPNHQFYPRPVIPVFRHPRLSWLDGRCVQGPGTYSPRHG